MKTICHYKPNPYIIHTKSFPGRDRSLPRRPIHSRKQHLLYTIATNLVSTHVMLQENKMFSNYEDILNKSQLQEASERKQLAFIMFNNPQTETLPSPLCTTCPHPRESNLQSTASGF